MRGSRTRFLAPKRSVSRGWNDWPLFVLWAEGLRSLRGGAPVHEIRQELGTQADRVLRHVWIGLVTADLISFEEYRESRIPIEPLRTEILKLASVSQGYLLLWQAVELVDGPPGSCESPPALLRLGVLEACFPAAFSVADLGIGSLLLPESTSAAVEASASSEVPPRQEEVCIGHVLSGIASSQVGSRTVGLAHVVLADHLADSELVETCCLQRRDGRFGASGIEDGCANLRRCHWQCGPVF